MDDSSRSQRRKRNAYRLKRLPLHLAGHQLHFSDEECIITFAQERNTPSTEKISSWAHEESNELRVHLTRPPYVLLKRLLERPGEIVSFEELVALVRSTSFPQPTHPFRALANHMYRLRKKLPKSLIIHCESGNGYALLLLPGETLYQSSCVHENP